jgi:hypothetical protein
VGYDDGPARWRPRASLECLRHLCSVAHRRTRRSDRGAAGTALRVVAAPAFFKATARSRRSSREILRAEAEKNGSSARVLTMTAAADLIRATFRNRVDNQVRGASLANHRHRRSDRSRAVLPTAACRGATSRSSPSTPSSLRRPCGGLTGRALGRRPVRGVTSEEGKSGPKALRAPSCGFATRRTGQLVADTIPSCRSEHPKRRRPRQHHRRRARFPRRRTGSRSWARPVSRRYPPVENTARSLPAKGENDRLWKRIGA